MDRRRATGRRIENGSDVRRLTNLPGPDGGAFFSADGSKIVFRGRHTPTGKELDDYMALLKDAFNPATVNGLMCRNTLSVSWRGEVFDCDFNQMLKMQWRDRDRLLSLWDIDPAAVEHRQIQTGEHCFGCTAGAGSSCGGALV